MQLMALALLATEAAASFAIDLQKAARTDMASLDKRGNIALETAPGGPGGQYFAEIEVGTPGQKVKVYLDTGSSDTWLNTIGTGLCDSGEFVGCDEFFAPNKSTSLRIVGRGDFHASYLDQRNVRGDFVNETVAINGKAIKNQKLGLARSQIPGSGLLGLGLSEGVAAADEYPTVVDNLVTQGHIERAAFSLFLNSSSSSSNVSGTILFGGVDTDKYVGNLTTLPLVPGFKPGSGVVAYAVHMSGLALDEANGERTAIKQGGDINVTAVLDSGTDLTFLPDDYVKPIWDSLGVEIAQKRAFVECKYAQDQGRDMTVAVTFANKTINVPLRELVVDTGKPELLKALGLELESPCIFGLQGTSANNITNKSFGILGSNLLRSAYVVYDATNRQVGIAQANVGSTTSNIVDLKAGMEFPAATGADEGETNNQPGDDGNGSAGDMVTPRFIRTAATVLSTIVFAVI